MDEKLLERLRHQVENEKIVRQTARWDLEEAVKLGALVYTALGLTADPEKILECQKILKNKAGFFSRFRGILQFVVLTKMTLEENPEAYIDAVIAIYEKITEKITLPGTILVVIASTIYDNQGDWDLDDLIKEILRIYAKVKKVHPYLTNEADMAYITLMVCANRANAYVEEEKESIFLELKNQYQLTAEVAQAVSLVLLTSTLPEAEKVERFIALFEEMKRQKHATGKNRYMSIYGVFTDLDLTKEEEAKALCEAEDYLKERKGYRSISSSGDFRKVLAATLVLQYYTLDRPSWIKERTESAEVPIESLLFTLIMNILVVNG